MEIDNCGGYSSDLKEIYEKIVNEKKSKGEKITLQDSNYIDTELFNAYQQILFAISINNSVAAATSIKDALEQLKGCSDVGSISQITQSVVQNIEGNFKADSNNNIVTFENVEMINKIMKFAIGNDINNNQQYYINNNFVIEDNENKNFAFRDEEDLQDEVIIGNIELQIKSILDDIVKNPNDADKYIEEFKALIDNTEKGLGVDAAIRKLSEIVNTNNYENPDIQIPAIVEMLGYTLERTEIQENNAYTTLDTVDLVSGLLENTNEHQDFRKVLQLFKEKDPEMYKIIDENLEEIKMLKEMEIDDVVGLYNVIDYLVNNGIDTYSPDAEEKFIASMIELGKDIEQNRDDEDSQKKQGNTSENKKETIIKKANTNSNIKSKSFEESYANSVKTNKDPIVILKSTVNFFKEDNEYKKIYAQGIVLSTLANNEYSNYDEKKYEEAKKEFFTNVITDSIKNKRNVDENFIEKMMMIDAKTLGKILPELENNPTTQNVIQYYNENKDRIAAKGKETGTLDSNKVSISDIKKMGQTQNNKNKQKDDEEKPKDDGSER